MGEFIIALLYHVWGGVVGLGIVERGGLGYWKGPGIVKGARATQLPASSKVARATFTIP